MSVYEMAKRYYPRLWSAERIQALVDAGRLSAEEQAETLGKTDNKGTEV